MRFISSLILFFIGINFVKAQSNSKIQAWYVEPEFMLGKVVPNFEKFPASPLQSSVFLNIGKIDYSPNGYWSGFYNYPSTGISASFSSYGNDSILGKQISIIPFLEVSTSRYNRNSFIFKFGLGSSYFSTYYNRLHNKTNMAIGSHFTWAFQLFLYYKYNISNHLNIKAGAGYLHCSNGHTQLPNYGLNSGMISLSAQYFFKPLPQIPHFEADKTRHYFYTIRTGLGMHEYGAAKGPIGGAKRPVYSLAIDGGMSYKQNLIIHAGFAYRFYQQYYNYIINKQPNRYDESPKLNASNVYFFLGSEFLIGHAAIDIEGGINIFKPFKNTFETKSKRTWLQEIFPSRMGLKLYAINTSKMPVNNVYLAANINANFGQADFSELSIGYVRRLK
jgi:hypothetical protein